MVEADVENLIAQAAYALQFGASEHETIEDLQDDHALDLEQAYLITRAAALLVRSRCRQRNAA